MNITGHDTTSHNNEVVQLTPSHTQFVTVGDHSSRHIYHLQHGLINTHRAKVYIINKHSPKVFVSIGDRKGF